MASKHIHFLGICGTFMGSLALLAKQMGYRVTGSDTGIYPPMSEFLAEQHIDIIPNFDPAQLSPTPDLIIVGNAMTRGNPCVEYMLEHNLPYTSGPQWLHDHLLNQRKVLAVSGTHGKTTTSSILAWILDQNGVDTGFLVGGILSNFGTSARLGSSDYFVIEADEYDTAFFDKRAKFVHYNPKVAIINNLEFDHADIYDNLAAIQRQFHHFVRLVPKNGLILAPKDSLAVQQTLQMGLWSRLQFVGNAQAPQDWYAEPITADCSAFRVFYKGELAGDVRWNLVGKHNMHNALMAIAAARYIDVPVENACRALASFINTKRRLEVKGVVNNVTVYDDFAHHPTAIATTLQGLRAKLGDTGRIIAVFEPRSNTMKMGVHQKELAAAFNDADNVFLFQPDNLQWNVANVAENIHKPTFYSANLGEFVAKIAETATTGDHIVIMSNGGFNGIHQKLLNELA